MLWLERDFFILLNEIELAFEQLFYLAIKSFIVAT